MKKIIKNYYYKRINDDSFLEENPFFSLIVVTPALIVSQVLVLPFSIIGLIFYPFKKYEIQIFLILFYLNNIISISSILYIEEFFITWLLSHFQFLNVERFLFSDFNFGIILANTILVIMFFPKTIYSNVMENMKKSYGEDWRELKSKKVAQFFYLQSKKLGRVGNMINGSENGKWTYYYQSGELKSKKEFSNGIIVTETCWDNKGNEVSCSKWDKYGNEI
tara:strand:+ start:5125 stop:5787 length:663 start_codon:yes stop_codon:yes gene_type:complete